MRNIRAFQTLQSRDNALMPLPMTLAILFKCMSTSRHSRPSNVSQFSIKNGLWTRKGDAYNNL